MVDVTVIIPAYNAEETLEKAVVSVLTQTGKSLEIIIINDCSSDLTGSIANSFAKRDDRVNVIHFKENKGKPTGVNIATRAAKGKWIAILDADDWYAKERIEKLVSIAEKNNVEMAADNQILFDYQANCETGIAFKQKEDEKHLTLKEFLKCSDATENFNFGMLKPVIKKSFLTLEKLEYCPYARLGEDYYFLLEFFVKGGRGILIKDPLYYYVQPFGSVSKKWATGNRGNYDFSLLYKVHQDYAIKLKKLLTSEDYNGLSKRGRSIKAIIAFHEFKEGFRQKNIKLIFSAFMMSPIKLSLMLIKRSLYKIIS